MLSEARCPTATRTLPAEMAAGASPAAWSMGMALEAAAATTASAGLRRRRAQGGNNSKRSSTCGGPGAAVPRAVPGAVAVTAAAADIAGAGALAALALALVIGRLARATGGGDAVDGPGSAQKSLRFTPEQKKSALGQGPCRRWSCWPRAVAGIRRSGDLGRCGGGRPARKPCWRLGG